MKKKKWWYVTGTATVTAYRFVRAETEEAAIDAARNSDVALCPYGPSRSGTTPLQEAIVEEADGAFEPGAAYEEVPHSKWLDEEEDEAEEAR